MHLSEGPDGARHRPRMVAAMPVVAMLAALRAFFALYRLYLPVAPPVVPGTVNSNGVEVVATGWATNGSMARVTTGAGEGAYDFEVEATETQGGACRLVVRAWSGVEAFVVAGRGRVDRIQMREMPYQRGNVLFFFRDANGRPHWDLPHAAFSGFGSRRWRPFRKYFPIPRSAVGAEAVVANQGRSGVLEVSDLRILPVQINPSTRAWFAVWGLLWAGAMAVWVGRGRLGEGPRGKAVMAAAVLIVAGMLIPEKWIANVHDAVVAALARSPPSPPAAPAPPPKPPSAPAAAPKPAVTAEAWPSTGPVEWDIHWYGHFGLFALLALLASRAYLPAMQAGVAGMGMLLLGLCLFALAAEQLQWLTLTRQASVRDVGVNLAGIAAGLALYLSARLLRFRSPA